MHNFIDSLKAVMDSAPPGVGGFLMAVMISIVRVIYDREETSFIRIMMESLICGFLTVAAGSAMAALGYGDNWYLFAGGMIGFLGSQSIRALAYKIIDKRVK
jgi:lambda family phage holin